jgi:translation initiation factor 2B subunit (eIF-2B alpha/beta/delta family)
MLQVALAEQGKPVQLSLPAADTMAQITAQQAQVLGAHAALTEDAALALDEASVCVIAAARVACDGAALGAPGAGQRAALARQRGLPVYALGYAGPDPALASAADLLPPDAPAGAEADILPPDLLGAIVTSRGVYRPAMVARHLRDGDAPLDVIRLG